MIAVVANAIKALGFANALKGNKMGSFLWRMSFCLMVVFGGRALADEIGPDDLAGTVVDEDGKPIEGVLADMWSWYKGNEATTDKNGRFHIKNSTGHFKHRGEVRFSKAGLSPVYNYEQDLGVSDLTVTMNAKTYIEGKVLAPDGAPVPNLLIRADSGPKRMEGGMHITTVWTETKSDRDGNYRLYLAPDSYKVQARVPDKGVFYQKLDVAENEAATQDLKLEEGLRFTVRCIDGDTQQPVPGVKVSVSRQKGMTATSDQAGLAVFEHMPPDKFEFKISSKEFVKWWWPDSPDENQRMREKNWQWTYDGPEVTLAPDMEPITVLFEKGTTYSGRVVDPDGKPVSGAIVVTGLVGYGDAIDETQHFTAKTKADGSFSLKLPSIGDHQFVLIAHDGDYDQWRKWANGFTEPMAVTPGQDVENLTIKLNVPAAVKGKVVDKSGNAKGGANVRVIATGDADSRYVAPSAKTDKDGNFTIKFVSPGEMNVQVEPFWSKSPAYENQNTTQIDHTPVTVDAGQTVEDVSVTSTR
jgi:hypothetical protein